VSKYKILTGKRVNEVESRFETPLELMINEMAEKDMSYKEMASVLEVTVAHIQVWLKRLEFGKAKRGARKQPVLSKEELKIKYALNF